MTGNLTVSGTTTTLDVATVNVEDINMVLGNGVGNDGSRWWGHHADSSDGDKTILFTDSTDSLTFNQHLFPRTTAVRTSVAAASDGRPVSPMLSTPARLQEAET